MIKFIVDILFIFFIYIFQLSEHLKPASNGCNCIVLLWFVKITRGISSFVSFFVVVSLVVAPIVRITELIP